MVSRNPLVDHFSHSNRHKPSHGDITITRFRSENGTLSGKRFEFWVNYDFSQPSNWWWFFPACRWTFSEKARSQRLRALRRSEKVGGWDRAMGKLMLYYLRDAIILSMIYHRQVTWVDLRLDPSHLFSKCLNDLTFLLGGSSHLVSDL